MSGYVAISSIFMNRLRSGELTFKIAYGHIIRQWCGEVWSALVRLQILYSWCVFGGGARHWTQSSQHPPEGSLRLVGHTVKLLISLYWSENLRWARSLVWTKERNGILIGFRCKLKHWTDEIRKWCSKQFW